MTDVQHPVLNPSGRERVSVLQPWVERLPLMQQSVLLTAVRGPDGLPKYHPSKYLLRWYRRSILISAFDGHALTEPCTPGGGSFTGPSVVKVLDTYVAEGGLRDRTTHVPDGSSYRSSWEEAMNDWVTAYVRGLDEVPHHFQLHFMHAAEIVGYKHCHRPVREWWNQVYVRLARDMHLLPEPEHMLDDRLSDHRDRWLAHGDEGTND